MADIAKIRENKRLAHIFDNIIIVKAGGKDLAQAISDYTGAGKDGITIKRSNVIAVTSASNKDNCRAFTQESTITFIDDTRLDTMDYYPLVEITLFTIAKALYNKGLSLYDARTLVALYRSLNIEKVAEDQVIPLFINSRAVTLVLLPSAPLNYDELHSVYQNIRQSLQAA
jgi:hypothetical protein